MAHSFYLKRTSSLAILLKSLIFRLILGGLGAFGLISCSFETPSPETPVINSKAELVSKTFFVNSPGTNGKTQPKSFLCGWAPTTERGMTSWEHVHMAPSSTQHCNLEWKINEHYLVGKMIRPSRPNQRNDWDEIITIPITRHYYYEAEKDKYGRDTNVFIKNEARDPWDKRPYMDLDFSGIEFHKWSYKLFFNKPLVTAVEDIEWDQKNNFLGFTIEAMDGVYGSGMQGRFRFNFMAFQHNPTFDRRSYDERNSQKLNSLHLVGKRAENGSSILFAAHWDLKKQRTVYLNGFPEEYIRIGEEIVEDWNKVFQEIGAVPKGFKPFVTSRKVLKHFFDLRYPSITWVSDPEISASSPLGVGLATADVLNGEILWGGIVIYGGLMENYINRFSPAEHLAATQQAYKPVQVQNLFDHQQLLRAPELPLAWGGNLDEMLRSPQAFERLRDVLAQRSQKIHKMLTSVDLSKTSDHANDLNIDLLSDINSYKKIVSSDILWPSSGPTSQYIEASFNKNLNFYNSEIAKQETQTMGAPLSQMSFEQKQQILLKMAQADLAAKHSSNLVDFDRRFIDVGVGWQAVKAMPGFNFEKALRNVIKFTITHEYGHFLGLGHQFSANLLPAKETVSASVYERLLQQAKEDATNYTSVMDYPHPLTEMLIDRDILPEIHDKHTLQYLYMGKFPVLVNGKYDYLDVPPDGLIPDKVRHPKSGQIVQTAYVPACNDLEASLGSNPYCERFDRGYDAESIARNHLQDLSINLVGEMNNFTDSGGGQSDIATGILWSKSLRHLGRVRVFYDYMRDLLKNDSKYVNAFNKIRRNQLMLYDFAKGCNNPEDVPSEYREVFAQLVYINSRNPDDGYTEVHSLCRATSLYLTELKSLLAREGSDHSVINYDQAVVPGGIRGGEARTDWSKVFGAYRQLGSLPLRLSSLLTLTTPQPYFLWGNYTVPIPRYSDSEAKYGLFSLYSKDFTEIVNIVVQANLRFGGSKFQESAEMGQSALYLPYLMGGAFYGSNDTKRRFPQVFIDTVREQTKFDFDIVPIILTSVKSDKRPSTRVFRFKTSYFDQAKREAIDIPPAYLLPDGGVIAKGLNNQIFLPLTRFRYVTDDFGYVWAYELKFTSRDRDPLEGHSVRVGLTSSYIDVIKKCVSGEANGLETFFDENNEEFDGFEVLPGIATNPESQIRFSNSVTRQFLNYWNSSKYGGKDQPPKPDGKTCEETVKGVALIGTGGSAVNGYYIMDLPDFLAQ